MTPDPTVAGWLQYRRGGPWHAAADDGGRTWCGLPGPGLEEPGPGPGARVCGNCARALRRGTPWRLNADLDVYRLYASSRLALVFTTRPGEGWREDYEARWRFEVRAYSLRQAVFLAAKRIRAAGPEEVGIVEVRAPTREPGEEVAV